MLILHFILPHQSLSGYKNVGGGGIYFRLFQRLLKHALIVLYLCYLNRLGDQHRANKRNDHGSEPLGDLIVAECNTLDYHEKDGNSREHKRQNVRDYLCPPWKRERRRFLFSFLVHFFVVFMAKYLFDFGQASGSFTRPSK